MGYRSMIDFDQRSSDAVDAYNSQRARLYSAQASALSKLNLLFAGLMVAVLVLAILAGTYWRTGFGVLIALVGLFSVGFGYFSKRDEHTSPGVQLQVFMRERLFPALYPEIENLSFRTDSGGFIGEFPKGLQPTGDRKYYGDLIEGVYKGLNIAINEVRITERVTRDDSTRYEEVFAGITVRTQLPVRVPNELIVTNNRLTVTKWFAKAFNEGVDRPAVGFDDKEFEAKFDVYCSSDQFAHDIFTDVGRARFLAMMSKTVGDDLQLAARENSAYLLISSQRNFFELPPLDRPFDLAEDGAKMRQEMSGFFDLIDETRALLAEDTEAQRLSELKF